MNCVSQNWKEGCSSWKENFKTNPMKKSKNKLPANLASGIENLAGIAMDGVQVHFNSTQPEQLEAHARLRVEGVFPDRVPNEFRLPGQKLVLLTVPVV